MKPQAVIYARISDVKGAKDAEKVPAQVAACKALARDAGYEVVRIFREAGGTSASTGVPRPQFEAMLQEVESGRIDVVVATETERLVRSDEDGLRLRVACAASHANWHTVRGGVVDVGTASGALMATLISSVGRYESRAKSERQRAKYARLRAEGLPHPGPRVFGWKDGRMEAEPREAQMIRAATIDLLQHGKVYRIVKAWNESGVLTTRGKPWTYAGVQQVLTRARNAGLPERQGDPRGKWEALVSEDEWRAVCALLRNPERRMTRNTVPRWLSAGIARCACGAPMRSAQANGRPYYRCELSRVGAGRGQRHVSVPADVLDEAVTRATVSAILFGPRQEGPADSDSARLASLHVALAELQTQVERLVDAVVAGALRPGDVSRRRRELEAQQEGLQAQIDDMTQRSAGAALLYEVRRGLWSGGRVSPVEAAAVRANIRAGFEKLDLEQRRALVKSLLAVTVGPGRGRERVGIIHRVATALNDEDAV